MVVWPNKGRIGIVMTSLGLAVRPRLEDVFARQLAQVAASGVEGSDQRERRLLRFIRQFRKRPAGEAGRCWGYYRERRSGASRIAERISLVQAESKPVESG